MPAPRSRKADHDLVGSEHKLAALVSMFEPADADERAEATRGVHSTRTQALSRSAPVASGSQRVRRASVLVVNLLAARAQSVGEIGMELAARAGVPSDVAGR